MKRFLEFFNRLPLAGKLAIGPSIFNFYFSRNLSERTWRYCLLIFLLSIFILGHTGQVYIGIDAFIISPPIWAKVIALLYMMVNAGVTVVQLSLLYRSTIFFFTGPFPRRRRFYKEYSRKEARMMIGLTLGGQTIFLLQYFHYK